MGRGKNLGERGNRIQNVFPRQRKHQTVGSYFHRRNEVSVLQLQPGRNVDLREPAVQYRRGTPAKDGRNYRKACRTAQNHGGKESFRNEGAGRKRGSFGRRTYGAGGKRNYGKGRVYRLRCADRRAARERLVPRREQRKLFMGKKRMVCRRFVLPSHSGLQ